MPEMSPTALPREPLARTVEPHATDALPLVTIVMPCLDEERTVEACLRSVLGQDYPASRMEIVIADGGSRDRTREIVRSVSAGDPRLTLIDNPDRFQAAGMNRAIERSRGDVILRMDVHCTYAADYVRRCVEALERTGADNVGGAQRARAETPFQQAVCAALQSPLGVGGASYRSARNEGFVDTVFLGAFRRRVFEEIGLYDPGARTNEDAELNHRIRAAGGRIFLSRDIVVHYSPRRSLAALVLQYYRYGRGRARTVVKHRTARPARSILPFGMVVAGAAIAAGAWTRPALLLAPAAYALLTGLEALRVARQLGALGVLRTWSIFPALHLSHGLGVTAGLARYLRHPDWKDPVRLPPRGSAAFDAGHRGISGRMLG